jgi:hypothetical protein
MCIIAASILEEGSRWSSNSRVIVDVPPSQPLRDSDSRWNSGDQVAIDRAPSQPLARHRMLLEPSRVSATNESLRHSTETRSTIKINRWNSGGQVAINRAPSQPLARRRMLLVETKQRSTIKITSPDVYHTTSSWSMSKLVVSDSSRFRCFGEQVAPMTHTHARSA